MPLSCPRCGNKHANRDQDGDLTCSACDELLVSYSNYRRELKEFVRIQNTRIRGLGRPRKGEVLVQRPTKVLPLHYRVLKIGPRGLYSRIGTT